MDGYIIIKYVHGELKYLAGYDIDVNGMYSREWTSNMEKSQLFALKEVFDLCDKVKGTAVQRIKFNTK